jgi:hypothetical protein
MFFDFNSALDIVGNQRAGIGFGEAHSEGMRYENGLLRPYYNDRGKRVVVINTGFNAKGEPQYLEIPVAKLAARGVPVVNATTTLRKQEWQMFDTAVLKVARARLRAWTDLAASSTYGGFNGMSKMVLEHETMSDPGVAITDMDALTESRSDSPRFQLEGVPLPITHSDFWFSARRLAISRNTGMPLDATMAEAAGRRVAELVERTLIGSVTGPTYGNNNPNAYGRSPTVYGYTNFTPRNTYVGLPTPTGSNGDAILDAILGMRDAMAADNFFGPYMIYTSNDWDRYLDDDYRAQDSRTLRMRIKEIGGITDVRRLDFFTSTFTMLMVQMTPDVARAVIGMPMTTVQWESQGGMKLNFKVMTIMVPQLRADFTGQCGILQATAA